MGLDDIREDLTEKEWRFLRRFKQRLIDNYGFTSDDADHEAYWVGSHFESLRA
ncbi:hypothetical protein [Mycobacterium angelicum]|uniref:hypothetical protein n=1 Tax=Mycobacterium angelicum TaxID=470074 RepID=UPI001474C1BE|nr:hypothetical protein [Mycobacterium angelicum]MCV7195397.1 hypothetical protein [Mycobacterium angelicum]